MKKLTKAIQNTILWSFALGIIVGVTFALGIAPSINGKILQSVVALVITTYCVLSFRDLGTALEPVKKAVSHGSTNAAHERAESGIEGL